MAYNENRLSPVKGLKALAQRIAADYATKAAMKEVSDRVDGLVTAGGEPNKLEAVLVNGEATVKRVYQKSGHIVLVPVSRNPVYQPQIYSGEDDVRILGKVTLSIVDVQ